MDPNLIDRARRGDKDAFTALVLRLGDRLYSVAYRILRDAGRAEDAVQQAFMTAWRELPRLRDDSRLEAWLHKLLVHAWQSPPRRRAQPAPIARSASSSTGSTSSATTSPTAPSPAGRPTVPQSVKPSTAKVRPCAVARGPAFTSSTASRRAPRSAWRSLARRASTSRRTRRLPIIQAVAVAGRRLTAPRKPINPNGRPLGATWQSSPSVASRSPSSTDTR